jgi:hypothetical protein
VFRGGIFRAGFGRVLGARAIFLTLPENTPAEQNSFFMTFRFMCRSTILVPLLNLALLTAF